MASVFERIILEGTPKERGLQYGKAAKDKIGKSIALYRQLFKAYANMEWDACKRRAETFLPGIEDYFQPAISEMEGIAEGAGLSFEDILTLNCRSEMMFNTAQIEGCTSMGLTSEVTADGKPYIAQTWDWMEPAREISLVLEIRQNPLPTILSVVEAGMIGGKGLNSAGLGVCLNALSCAESGTGVPLHLLYRGILNAWKLPDAIEAVVKPPRAGTGNFMIGSDSDQVLFIEYMPKDYDIMYAEEGWLAHANHYLSPLFAAKDRMKMLSYDTFTRLGRTRKLIRQHLGTLDIDRIRHILSDHLNHPDGVCSHPDPHDPEMHRMCTVYGAVMDMTERTLYVSNSFMCQGDLYPFVLMPGV